MAKGNSKGMAPNGRSASSNSFAGIPRWVMETEDYMALKPNSVKLLNELAYQYKGKNNGDLTVAWNVLKGRGWRSRTTIEGARNDLIERDWIVCTREGRFLNPGGVCALYALRWAKINECAKFDRDAIPVGKRQPRYE